ncbi:MAG: SIR2 family protein [Candidatus Jettenia sp.]|uniref:Uncharacterized protein n=1 Tax=Candidatus Jettenia caeni TaxID=247490 RepID=I3IIB5_9BACT|nr:SIR2 family protein [Candidatus Jettenia sp. AMX1]MBC6928300.1 SIR2 family protein [Candidatus Jettenia sp.]NUN21963.1 SIR2 family protein [Candidatus Jettenia caeni]KAA0249939.1 MAG: SIR2 family protein [Candidatus Jettenia sp. AMX1]MCE7880417.1 SIR2 family protein [Candidatus Jettenia sp. AMX1]MCQ3926225.1 SIR2 family protein [Candidatus Jettenia sp.]
MEEMEWQDLITDIKDGKCIPFLGAGANGDILPLGREVATELANKHEYPFKDSSKEDLIRVAQFLATKSSPMFPKKEILRVLKERLQQKEAELSNFFRAPDEILSLLAEMPFRIYMTTNYDDLIIRALNVYNKSPERELCRWNKHVKDLPSIFDEGFKPTEKNPVVFHLHGHDKVPESIVISEDDYLDFLVNISRNNLQQLIPPIIQCALSRGSLLFIGYRMADMNFRVIFKGLVESIESSVRSFTLSVQIPPNSSTKGWKKQKEYLEKYFGNMKIRVYWGNAKEFAIEFRKHWR